MPRLTGQVQPYIPASAPLSYRLSEEVYALDGDCSCPSHTQMAAGHRHAIGGLGDIASVIPMAAILGVAVYFVFLRK
jgi:hypothetical protein